MAFGTPQGIGAISTTTATSSPNPYYPASLTDWTYHITVTANVPIGSLIYIAAYGIVDLGTGNGSAPNEAGFQRECL